MKWKTVETVTLKNRFLTLLTIGCLAQMAVAQTPVITLDFTKPGANVSPTLYGLMTEEINHSYDGGLYAELIRNRIFKDNKSTPEGWSLVKDDPAAKANIKLVGGTEEKLPYEERRLSINGALTTCLRLTVEKAAGRVGIANEGYWGIPIKPSTAYKASFYIKGTARTEPFRFPWEPKPTTPKLPDIENHTAGPVTVTLESNDGKTVYASGTINLEKNDSWKKYSLTLTTASNVKPYVDDALDEIQYVIGDTTTYWGAKRATDGHPAPFRLRYVEVGNEDWFDITNSYNGRFTQFRNVIEAKYPQLTCISTIGDVQYPNMKVTSGKKPDVVDEHYYRNSWEMWENAAQYDTYDREGPKIFVGEWATREGTPTTNLNAALGDAAWMTGMERNADLIIMSCYAPLFVNVSEATATAPKAWQWDSDLIGYDALSSYGSPSYYVQKLFSQYLGNKIVSASVINVPVQNRPLTKKDSTEGIRSKTVPTLFYSVTMNDTTGSVYLKMVNTTAKKQSIKIKLDGIANVSPEATLVIVKGDKPEDTNTINEPVKIVPVTTTVKGISKSFTRNLYPYSVSILQLQTGK